MTLPTRAIAGLEVSAVGIGCLPLSEESMVDQRERAIATLHRALDLGITFLDTANIYAPHWDQIGHNERVVAEALRSYPGGADHVVVATKGGITWTAGDVWGRDGSADGLRRACEASLEALDVDRIALYQLHRHDSAVPYADQVRHLVALQDAGLVAHIGLSNVTLAELDVAIDVAGGPADDGIVSVQNEWSPRFRGDGDVLHACTERGIAFLPWSPLGGADQAHDIGSRYSAFTEVGTEVGASAQEVILAWLLATSPVVIPIPGASRPATVDSIVRSLGIELTGEHRARLDATLPAGDSMYPDDTPRPALR